jgi:hypothetical protein
MHHVVHILEAGLSVIPFFAVENRFGADNIITNISKPITETPIEDHTQAPNTWSEAGLVDIEESRFPQTRSCFTQDIVEFD